MRVLHQVGASLSMVYRTGQPIVFVGTGQKYVPAEWRRLLSSVFRSTMFLVRSQRSSVAHVRPQVH